ncbi:hypothetical protein TNCV_4366191 [Trichonephila clavipes]|nr:hypothetical protein TNCV_4366191 [Trichonephila clavipes]
MVNMFSRHESNRERLGRSRKTSCWPPTTPQTLQELKRAFLEEWDRIPQLVINSLIDSMPQRYLNFFKRVIMPRIKKIGRRKYTNNQHKKSKSTEELLSNSVESASRRKTKIPDLLKEQDSQNVNIIVELDLLSSLMKNLLCCKYCCSEKIELREDLKSRRGLAVSL